MAEIKPDTDNNPSYDHSHYGMDIRLVADLGYSNESPLLAIFNLACHDLPQLMQEGIFRTTSNMVPELGYIDINSPDIDGKPSPSEYARHLGLREWPSKPAGKSHWVASPTYYSSSHQDAANFPIEQLSRDNITTVNAWNTQGNKDFGYSYLYPDTTNINCIYPRLQPSFRSWWMWPMDRLEAASSHSEAVKEPGYIEG